MIAISLVIGRIFGIAGVIGAMTTAGSLWQLKERSISAKQVFWGWVAAMSIGGMVNYLSGFMLGSLEDWILRNLIKPIEYDWYLDVIAEVFAWCLTGATIGLIGARLMLSKDELLDHAKEE